MYERCARFKIESIIGLHGRAPSNLTARAPIDVGRLTCFSEKVVQGPSLFATSRCANKKLTWLITSGSDLVVGSEGRLSVRNPALPLVQFSTV